MLSTSAAFGTLIGPSPAVIVATTSRPALIKQNDRRGTPVNTSLTQIANVTSISIP
jgi:hypothetical protein